ncbi:uncharacterized protein LOC119109381 [Pollicipes pollicipes]|uniref:uncharacterized protein LOC119109381 n=1 Tax=Pollicipes pollicipes TaxID=41117 RepID=UPI001884FE58|nr:uncharacterized protein LOC119109381 [Pollicipes pollicipes]
MEEAPRLIQRCSSWRSTDSECATAPSDYVTAPAAAATSRGADRSKCSALDSTLDTAPPSSEDEWTYDPDTGEGPQWLSASRTEPPPAAGGAPEKSEPVRAVRAGCGEWWRPPPQWCGDRRAAGAVTSGDAPVTGDVWTQQVEDDARPGRTAELSDIARRIVSLNSALQGVEAQLTRLERDIPEVPARDENESPSEVALSCGAAVATSGPVVQAPPGEAGTASLAEDDGPGTRTESTVEKYEAELSPGVRMCCECLCVNGIRQAIGTVIKDVGAQPSDVLINLPPSDVNDNP